MFINDFEKILDSVQASMPKGAILVNARQAAALKHSEESIRKAFRGVTMSDSPELIVADLRFALISLGEITEPIDNDLVLDELFKNFCIGK